MWHSSNVMLCEANPLGKVPCLCPETSLTQHTGIYPSWLKLGVDGGSETLLGVALSLNHERNLKKRKGMNLNWRLSFYTIQSTLHRDKLLNKLEGLAFKYKTQKPRLQQKHQKQRSKSDLDKLSTLSRLRTCKQ